MTDDEINLTQPCGPPIELKLEDKPDRARDMPCWLKPHTIAFAVVAMDALV